MVEGDFQLGAHTDNDAAERVRESLRLNYAAGSVVVVVAHMNERKPPPLRSR